MSSRSSDAGWGLTALRVVVGALMAGHGLQKLAGWFGGGGLEQTATGFDRLGLRPGRPHAVAAGITEVLSGTGALLGAATPLASAMTTGTMTVAVSKVHGRNGPWITKGGYEYNATLIAVAFALAAAGPGRAAIDGRLLRRRAGLGWAFGQLALGAGCAAAVMWNAGRAAAVE
jgi:putative oxidoreductase